MNNILCVNMKNLSINSLLSIAEDLGYKMELPRMEYVYDRFLDETDDQFAVRVNEVNKENGIILDDYITRMVDLMRDNGYIRNEEDM